LSDAQKPGTAKITEDAEKSGKIATTVLFLSVFSVVQSLDLLP
jgi:hypothetical protein